jgi:rRNA maturation endonuclease Nob1
MGLFRRKQKVEDESERCPVCTERLPDDADECAMCGANLKALRPSSKSGAGRTAKT